MNIIRCRTNHMINPLGFAMEQAVVSWVADSDVSKKQVKEEELLGNWITTPWEDQSISPYIRKNVSFSQNVTKARLYMTGLGLYWLEVNGQKVGNDFFAPGCTGIDKLIQVYTYDLRDMLKQGENVLGVMMGNGWTKGLFGTSSKFHLEPYLDDYLLKAELRVEYADGSEQVIVTDDSWKCTPSPILTDSIYDGEVYDERKAVKNWSDISCCDCDWENMKIAENIKVNVPEHPTLGKLYDRLSLPRII